MNNLVTAEDIKEKIPSDRNSSIFNIDNYWERIKRESFFIYLSVSNRCNMNCQLCYDRTPSGGFNFSDLRVDDIKYILKRIGRNKKVCFTGGEPTLNEDLFEFIRLTRNSGNIPFLFTNGIRLANLDYTKKLAQTGLKKIYLTLDSLMPSVEEYFTGAKNSLDCKLEALENLKKLKSVKVYLSCRIARGINEDQIKEILDFAIANNEIIKGVSFCAATPTNWFKIPESCSFSARDLVPVLEKTTGGNLSQEYFREFNKLRQNFNFLLRKIGGSFPCEENSVYASIENGTLRELISSDELKEINKCLISKKYYALIKILFRHKRLLSIYGKVLNPAVIEFEFYRRNGLQIELVEIRPINEENLEIVPMVKRKGTLEIYNTSTPF